MKPSAPIHRLRARQRGQSTVEFMLMLPVLFSMYFFTIQMSLFFTTINYAQYTSFATARGVNGNFNTFYPDAASVSKLILNGAVWGGEAASLVPGGVGTSVQVTNFEDRVPLPFIQGLLPPMNFTVTSRMGPAEVRYEGVDGRSPDQYDNNSRVR